MDFLRSRFFKNEPLISCPFLSSKIDSPVIKTWNDFLKNPYFLKVVKVSFVSSLNVSRVSLWINIWWLSWWLMTVRWLSDDYPMTAWWLSDDCLMTVRRLSNACLTTFQTHFNHESRRQIMCDLNKVIIDESCGELSLLVKGSKGGPK